jgi:hypothetical protein
MGKEEAGSSVTVLTTGYGVDILILDRGKEIFLLKSFFFSG